MADEGFKHKLAAVLTADVEGALTSLQEVIPLHISNCAAYLLAGCDVLLGA